MTQSKTQAAKGQQRSANADGAGRVVVENVLRPESKYTLDAGMYQAMRQAMLKVLPRSSPGLTPTEMLAAVLPHLPEDRFPGGAKAGWWMKAVQLDLEAKKVIARATSKPVRLHKA